MLDEAFLLGLPAIVPAAARSRTGSAGQARPSSPRARPISPAGSRRSPSHPEILSEWAAAIPKLRPFPAHTREVIGVYREVLGSAAPLPSTPRELRARRARFHAFQIERRIRRMQFLESDKQNLTGDVDRANATMRDMHHYHLEKDGVIEELRSSVAAIEKDLEAQTGQLRSSVAALEKDLEARTDELEATQARIDEARTASADLVAELGKAKLEINEVVRRASEHEHELKAEVDRAFAHERAATQALERREVVLTNMASTLENALVRLGAAERAVARASRPPAKSEPTSIFERIKRRAFGDERGPPGTLKILYVVHQFLPRHVAGTEVCTYNLAREMKARGHQVAVLTCEAHHDRPPFERTRREQDGIPVHEVVHNYRWSSFEETYDSPRADVIFTQILDEEAPDVVHIQHLHYFSANFITIAHRRGIPIVYTLHDWSILCMRDGQLRRADGELCETAIPSKCADCITHFALDPEHVPARSRPDGGDGLVPPDIRQVLRRVHAGRRRWPTTTRSPASRRPTPRPPRNASPPGVTRSRASISFSPRAGSCGTCSSAAA